MYVRVGVGMVVSDTPLDLSRVLTLILTLLPAGVTPQMPFRTRGGMTPQMSSRTRGGMTPQMPSWTGVGVTPEMPSWTGVG